MRQSLSHVLSVLYAWVLILVGAAFSVYEALRESWFKSHVVAVYNTYLELIASAFLVYMLVHQFKARKKTPHHDHEQSANPQNGPPSEVIVIKRSPSKLSLSTQNLPDAGSATSAPPTTTVSLVNTQKRDSVTSMSLQSKRGSDGWDSDAEQEEEEEIEEYITLHSGSGTITNEVTSFYLRLGVLVFAIGNLLYLGLQLENNHGQYADCNAHQEINYPYYFHLIFVVVQTFFLFKHSKLLTLVVLTCMRLYVVQLMLKRHRDLVNFGVMHVLATNMCIWVRVLVFEVMEAIHLNHDVGGHAVVEGMADPVDDNSSCPSHSLLHDAAPYLFPFVLEYSLIGAATMAVMYQALSIKVGSDIVKAIHNAILRNRNPSRKQEGAPAHFQSHGHHDHHDEDSLNKSHVGMFGGFLVLTGCIIAIILYFYWYENGDEENADLALMVTDLINNLILLLLSMYSIYRLNPLAYSDEDNNIIDHVLLLVAFAGLFLLETFTLLMAASIIDQDNNVSSLYNLFLANSVVNLFQGIVQSIHIIDGMQRFVRTTKQERRKPARGVITYLIIANVATWLFKTIQEKKLFQTDEVEFYGGTSWAIMLNVTLPLQLFFSFHSSICLAHMWHSIYHPRGPLVDDDQVQGQSNEGLDDSQRNGGPKAVFENEAVQNEESLSSPL